jgi:exodeoxyribonuclease-3
MRLVSWNVNGIRAVQRKGLFDPFVTSLSPDVICLQETKAQQHESNHVIDGYQEFWHSAQKKGYSGTALFSRPAPLAVTQGLPAALVKKYSLGEDVFGNPNDEGRTLTAEYEDFYLVNVYTPNAKGDLSRLRQRYEQWDPAFLAYLKKLKKNKPVVLCGDLNVAHTPDDLANPKANVGKAGYTNEERQRFEEILEGGFVDSFRLFTQGNGHYTWWSNFSAARDRNVGWRIDYFLVSSDLVSRVSAAQIHADLYGSDHCPVSITLDL